MASGLPIPVLDLAFDITEQVFVEITVNLLRPDLNLSACAQACFPACRAREKRGRK